ncbi:MAG: tRNA pseudouridine(38-40) synthase TruA [Verrucomicrobia bacterium GWC2_42_7]|nr:MAG: tRNA pseudouridine(38-40) synthase TruA [Verrucomicrobia bacterium GWC2_42_7]
MKWKCTCAYDGTDFLGWQSQVGGNTIQDFIEQRLLEIFKRQIRIHGSGRTDSGVHARGQVFHFEADWPHEPVNLLRAFRSGLPSGIQVWKVMRAKPDFHARYSVKKKRYFFEIYLGYPSPFEYRYCWSLGNRRPDIEKMQLASKIFLGTHDFSAFGAKMDGDSSENPIKTLYRLDVACRGPRLRITTEASGYLYKMVRTLVGTLVEIGLDKLSIEEASAHLQKRIRTEQIVTAPAKGLFLDKVYYR